MIEVPIQDYVESTLRGLEKRMEDRFCEIDKRVIALNESHRQNMSNVALAISILALVTTIVDIAFWIVSRR